MAIIFNVHLKNFHRKRVPLLENFGMQRTPFTECDRSFTECNGYFVEQSDTVLTSFRSWCGRYITQVGGTLGNELRVPIT